MKYNSRVHPNWLQNKEGEGKKKEETDKEAAVLAITNRKKNGENRRR